MSKPATTLIDIVRSDHFQEAIVGPMVEAFERRLTRPGADGRTYRSFILDWLYFERPMLDRFVGERFNVQFEGPALSIDGTEYPLGGLIYRELEWVRVDPVEAFRLRQKLRTVVDAAVTEWMAGRPMKFLPAVPEKPFADRAAADAEDARIIRDFLASSGKPEADG